MRDMKRREFISLLGGAAAAWPLAAWAQQPRRIGVLLNSDATDPEMQSRNKALEAGLRDLGWVDGRNLTIDYRWADTSSLRSQAAELVASKPELNSRHYYACARRGAARNWHNPDHIQLGD